jgi:hypothetical protein
MQVKLPSLTQQGKVHERQQALVDKIRDGLHQAGIRNIDQRDAHVALSLTTPTLGTDKVHDGVVLGRDGLFSPLTSLGDIAPVLPENGAPVRESVILVNGIMTDIALQQRDMQGLANTGAAVVGVHNATEGMARDLLECVQNKLNRGDTPSIDTLARFIAVSLEKEEPVRVIGHSQGALIVARALQIVAGALEQAGLTKAETKAVLGRVSVETYGGAAQNYVDGPRYTHVLNKADLVPMLTGVGLDAFNPFGHVGEAAVIKDFVEVNKPRDLPPVSENGITWTAARAVDQSVHGPRDVYWKHRRS